jgi:hypothetical protein
MKGGHVIDPANDINGITDVYVLGRRATLFPSFLNRSTTVVDAG